MSGPSLLYTHPPEGSEGPELPLKALSERFEVSLTEFGILWEVLRLGQRHEDNPSSEGPEGVSVDCRQTSEEIPAAFPGETPHPISEASTAMPLRTELVTCFGVLGVLGVLEGECRYRPPYGRGDIGTRLM
jgi:hypothetical protein